jgi:HEAT repeat protein
MKGRRDIPGLISALRHPDMDIQWRAAAALGSLGPDAIHRLIAGLSTRHRAVKLGIIEALGEIRDAQAVEALIRELRDASVEVRWEAALALGEIGEGRAIAPLLPGLRDRDRYVRYGSALALGKLGWAPATGEEEGFRLLGLQDWAGLAALGAPAIPALTFALSDRERTIRRRAVEVLGGIGNEAAIPAIQAGLRDPDDEVRWQAVLAGPRCGIAPMYLPRGLSQRPRARKSPAVAGFLNLVLPGQGYLYLGRWWGVLIFQVDVTATLWLFATAGDQSTYGLLLPIYVVLAAHAWYLAGKMPEM